MRLISLKMFFQLHIYYVVFMPINPLYAFATCEASQM